MAVKIPFSESRLVGFCYFAFHTGELLINCGGAIRIISILLKAIDIIQHIWAVNPCKAIKNEIFILNDSENMIY